MDTIKYWTPNKTFLNGIVKDEALIAWGTIRKMKWGFTWRHNKPEKSGVHTMLSVFSHVSRHFIYSILNVICVLVSCVCIFSILSFPYPFICISFLTMFYDRLFLMLQRFPVESKGRRKKLQEVCFVFY